MKTPAENSVTVRLTYAALLSQCLLLLISTHMYLHTELLTIQIMSKDTFIVKSHQHKKAYYLERSWLDSLLSTGETLFECTEFLCVDGLPGDTAGEGDLALDLVRDLDLLFFFFSWGLLWGENIPLKGIYSSMKLAQWKALFTLLKDYAVLFHRIHALRMHYSCTTISYF